MNGLSFSLAGTIGRFTLAATAECPSRGITGLFGPSASGKTSVLRGIAGFLRLPAARVNFGDEVWQDGTGFVPPERRRVATVFQDGALFPHLNVRGNLDFACRRSGASEFDHVVAMLDLAPLLERRVGNLSGGERQRVALARALLSQPQLLLLDEPVSALDRNARHEILDAIALVSSQLQMPMLFVSHDLAEMARIADHLILIDHGCVIGGGALPAVLTDLASPLAMGPHALSVLEAQVAGFDAAQAIALLAIDGEHWLIPAENPPAATHCRLRVTASDVGISRKAPPDTTLLNMPLARIAGAAHLAGTGQMNVLVRLGPDGLGQMLLARISMKSWNALRLQPGECVHLMIKGVGLAETE